MIYKFQVDIPQESIEDLKLRISNTRWSDALLHSEWEFGTNLEYLKSLADYWSNDFEWRKVEAEINSYPNYIAEIDGLKIHFIHIKSKRKNAIPLIITHGWPGSFIEMLKLIPLLTEQESLSFDLVIPSIPGFGFSEKPGIRGYNSCKIADLWHKLMLELGYEKYGAQGGDIGSGISTWLAIKYPDNMIGLHLNYISGSYKPYLKPEEKLSNEVVDYQKYASEWSAKEGAYA